MTETTFSLRADQVKLFEQYDQWSQTIRQAANQGKRLRLAGQGSKKHILGGRIVASDARVLDTRAAVGILDYQPSELYVTVAAGTPVAWLEDVLAQHQQCLPFEPPRWGAIQAPPQPVVLEDGRQLPIRPLQWQEAAQGMDTVGGMVAMGLSGPARATVGSVRDHVLGMRWINGQGQQLRTGGTVIKNVAGYDVSRLLVGSLGALGLICDVTLKVLPMPAAVATVRFPLQQTLALQAMNRWAGQPWPITGSAWQDGILVVRLAGSRAVVRHAVQHLGEDLAQWQVHGEGIDPLVAHQFWLGLRDHCDEFFVQAREVCSFDAKLLRQVKQWQTEGKSATQSGADQGINADWVAASQRVERGHVYRLWRLSVPSNTAELALDGDVLIEWGGALRWLLSHESPERVRELVQTCGGHAQVFIAPTTDAAPIHQAVPKPLADISIEVRKATDPHHVFDASRWQGAW